ncbi:AfsR/SARP family transcriptional regulator [Actinomadura decatromicini]|nr:AfsR/SARP family transcriptional regulator [Actinomadura decatromicini]
MEIVSDDDRTIPVKASKMAQILALLLVRRNEVVSSGTLMEELWCQNPPRSASTTLQTYVYHARRMFAGEGISARDGEELLITRSPGYLLRIDDHEVDVGVFEELVMCGSACLDRGDLTTGLLKLEEALATWRGPVFATVPTGPILDDCVVHLEELRLRALGLRVETLRQLGRHQIVVPELRSLVTSYPLNEFLHYQLINSLFRSGRRAEALKEYHSLRKMLANELGVAPTSEVERLFQEMLGNDRITAGVAASPVDLLRSVRPA